MDGMAAVHEAHQILAKITRQMGTDAYNMDTAESRRRAGGGAAAMGSRGGAEDDLDDV